MNMRTLALLATGLLYAAAGSGQTPVSEDFTGASTTNSWYYSGGACLTAGSTAGTGAAFTPTTSGAAGALPGCINIQNKSDAYNGETLVGGSNANGLLPMRWAAARCASPTAASTARTAARAAATTSSAPSSPAIRSRVRPACRLLSRPSPIAAIPAAPRRMEPTVSASS